jgi:hypothetical protein
MQYTTEYNEGDKPAASLRHCSLPVSPGQRPLANHRETSPFLDLPAVM